MTVSKSLNSEYKKTDTSTDFLFKLFCVLTYVLLGRPQDIFPFLIPLRPALTIFSIFFLIYLLYYKNIQSKVSFDNPQIKIFFVLFIIMIASIPFAYHKRFAFMFLFLKYLPNVFYFYFFIVLVSNVKRIKTILFVCCISTAVYSIASFAKGQLFGQRLFFGTIFDPNDIAFILISFLPFNFLYVSKGNRKFKRIISVANIIISILVILMTGSRGGFLGLLILAFMFLFVKTKTIKISYKIFIGIAMFFLVSTYSTLIDTERFETLLNIKEDYNVTDEFGRFEIWKKGFKIMLQHPLTGVGVSCFPEAIGTYREKKNLIPKWQTAHNSLILIGAETGIIGFILFALLIFRALKIFRKAKKQGTSEDVIKIGEMTNMSYIPHIVCAMLLSQAYSIYMVFFIALSAVLYKLLNRQDTEGAPA